jgi:hypothetical protein
MHIQTASKATRDAIRNTQDCQAICIQTAQYCLEVGGPHAAAVHVRHLQDCADICAATTNLLLRGARYNAEVATACANLCDVCAVSCQEFVGDAQMKACENQCLLCASACRQAAAGQG